LSLRTRVIAAVSLIAVALVAVLVFVTRNTEANLTAQIDDDLAGASGRLAPVGLDDDDYRGGPERREPAVGEGQPPELSAVYVGVLTGDDVVTVATPGLGDADLALPELDLEQVVDAAESGEPFSVSGEGSGSRWRVLAAPSRGDVVTIIGMPLDSVDDAIGDLVTLELIAAAVILVALALVAFWVIRLGVAPLRKMTRTATAIADGDLTRRVPESPPDTEAGELGDALNKMLASIEESFGERDRAEARLRQFVADASHELRTPVATIRGYAELYRSGGLDDRERLDDAMRRTEAEAIRMGGLVEDMLSLARLDEGRPLELVDVDLAVVAEDAAADARAVDPDRPLRADTAGSVIVRADEARIRQVVANLVGNALAHTPAGTPVTVTCGTEEGSPFLEVADEGPGMSAESSARAFERFYRADPARSRHAGSSGLGLAIVEATVHAHGGEVLLESAPGEGTRVRVVLPEPEQD
jgi:two-component system OmpR family sensor kinase